MNCKLIKQKIVSGDIKSWPDVYRYTTAYQMAKVLGRSENHWKHVKNDPMLMSIGDMMAFISAVKITVRQFVGGGGWRGLGVDILSGLNRERFGRHKTIS